MPRFSELLLAFAFSDQNLYAFVISPVHAASPAYLILDLIAVIIL
jgi:hypothetical protein